MPSSDLLVPDFPDTLVIHGENLSSLRSPSDYFTSFSIIYFKKEQREPSLNYVPKGRGRHEARGWVGCLSSPCMPRWVVVWAGGSCKWDHLSCLLMQRWMVPEWNLFSSRWPGMIMSKVMVSENITNPLMRSCWQNNCSNIHQKVNKCQGRG